MTAVPRRRPAKRGAAAKPKLSLDALVESFTAFRAAKTQEAEAKKTAEQLRDETLMPALIEYGEAHGEKGVHLAIELPEPVDGYVRLVRRANTSRLLDVDAAEALLKGKGVLEECQITTVVIHVPTSQRDALETALSKVKVDKLGGSLVSETRFSQDAMYAYHQTHRDDLTETEIDGLIVEETSYSFFPERR